MIDARNVTMLEQMAKNALTNITTPPVAGQAYRNTRLEAVEMANGDRYDHVFDSAKYNQAMWMITGLLEQAEQFGLLPYSELTNYQTEALCLGLDGVVYKAILPSGPGAEDGPQPTSNDLYWKDYVKSYYAENIETKFWMLQRLTAATDFYVNGSTGNDDLTVNDGLTPETAWKTIQGGVNNIASTYFLGLFHARLNVSAGTFNEDVSLPRYMTTQGQMSIIGDGKGRTILRGGIFGPNAAGQWNISHLTVQFAGRISPGSAGSRYDCFRSAPGCEMQLSNVEAVMGNDGNFSRHAFLVVGGTISLRGAGNSAMGAGASFFDAFDSGRMIILNDISLSGSVTLASAYATNVAAIVFDPGVLGRAPVVSGTVTGPRATANNNGIINTAGSGGQAAWPGSVNGTTTNGGQIV